LAQDAPPRRVFVRYWLPVLAYVALIFVVSAQPRLQPPMKFQNSDKLAHVAEYGVLGFLLGRALHTVPATAAPLAAGGLAVVVGTGVAVSDELFQSLVPGRDSSLLDIVADVLGLALSQLVYLWARRP
jgi:VanZ family protein